MLIGGIPGGKTVQPMLQYRTTSREKIDINQQTLSCVNSTNLVITGWSCTGFPQNPVKKHVTNAL